jgi:hypothetical protein
MPTIALFTRGIMVQTVSEAGRAICHESSFKEVRTVQLTVGVECRPAKHQLVVPKFYYYRLLRILILFLLLLLVLLQQQQQLSTAATPTTNTTCTYHIDTHINYIPRTTAELQFLQRAIMLLHYYCRYAYIFYARR